MSQVEPGWEARCHRLIRSARILLNDGDCDSAVSRAYYAMLFAAEALLASRDLTYSSHHAVISALGKEFVKTDALPAHLHRALIDAAEARTMGDYMVDSGLAAEHATAVIERAVEFVAEAERHLSAGENR